jgi:hypothetical protein
VIRGVIFHVPLFFIKTQEEVFMKSAFLLFGCSILLSAASAYAQPNPQSCTNLKAACEAGGFTKDGEAGKDLRRDCFERLKRGDSVMGVLVNPQDVSSCENTILWKKETRSNLRNETKALDGGKF